MAETNEAPTRTPTIADVARVAGVSIAAVSYVLSSRSDHAKRVGAQTRERIESAIAELGYVRNQAARHLRRRRTDRICVVLFELGNPFADRLANDIDKAARDKGFSIIVTTGRELTAWRRLVGDMEAGLADAMVLDIETEGVDDALIDELLAPLRRSGRPVLMFHSTAKVDGISVVRHQRAAALQLALDYAHNKGHERLCYVVNGEMDAPNVRRDLVRAFARDHGMAEPMILGGADHRSAAATIADTIIDAPNRPSLILSESDFSAVAVIHALQKRGLRVPQDIAVIGCGNAEEGQYSLPALTTIGPAKLSLIEEAAHLIDRVEKPDTTAPRDYLVPWQLIVRESA